MSNDAPAPLIDPTSAQMALSHPATPAAVLAQIAHAYPPLRAGVAAHPNCYPALLDWLDTQGDPAVSQAVAARRAAAAAAPVVPATPSAPYPQAVPTDPAAAQYAQGVQGVPGGVPGYSPSQPYQPYAPGYGQWPYGAPPQRSRKGPIIGAVVAAALIIIGLIVGLFVVPAMRGGGGGGGGTETGRVPDPPKQPAGWSQPLDLGADFNTTDILSVIDAQVGDIVVVTDGTILKGVDLAANKVLWTVNQAYNSLRADDAGGGLVIRTKAGNQLLVIDPKTGNTTARASLTSNESLRVAAAGMALTVDTDTKMVCARELTSLGNCKWKAKQHPTAGFVFGNDRWFNTASGVVDWKTGQPASFGADAGRSSDSLHDVVYTVGTGSDLVTRVAADRKSTSGDWSYTLQPWNPSTDKAAGATVSTGSSWWVPGPLIVAFNEAHTTAVGYDKATGEKRWTFTPQDAKMKDGMKDLIGNTVIIEDSFGGFIAIDAKTGQQVYWTAKMSYDTVSGPLGRGVLYATDTSRTTLYAFDGNSPTFAQLWTVPMPSDLKHADVYALANHVIAVTTASPSQLCVLT